MPATSNSVAAACGATILVSRVPSNVHRVAMDIPVILGDHSLTRVTMCASSWAISLWSQIIHVVEKFRHVCIASEGECYRMILEVQITVFK